MRMNAKQKKSMVAAAIVVFSLWTRSTTVLGFAPSVSFLSSARFARVPHALYASSTSSATGVSALESSVAKLKKTLEREYTSFFDPMVTEYYAKDVTFDDPMTTLEGVAQYQANVDMLASRTLLGSLLFRDAGIVLHSVEGGEIVSNTQDGTTTISDIITRWTLRMTAKILPWQPTARFTGISVYKVEPADTPQGVVITGQTDYWDSVNMAPGGGYRSVDKALAIGDFLNQLKPGGAQAQSAAPELPYQLLRRGDGYEVRRYPSYAAVTTAYERRDEGFAALGSFTQGMAPLAPAIMEVPNNNNGGDKQMVWPLSYAAPGEEMATASQAAIEKSSQAQWKNCQVVTLPSRVVAVAEFSDASMEPVVRKADAQLRRVLERDGIQVPNDTAEGVKFAQYDAVFSMGKRRGEVWIDLEDGGHPW